MSENVGNINTNPPYPRPLPPINQMNHHFWCGGKDGKLHLMQCGNCGYYIHPYGPVCKECLSKDVSVVAVSGRGTIRAVSVNHQPWFPGVPVPYVVALVQLDEQENIRLPSNILNCAVEDVVPGMKVKVCFEQYGEIFLPLFEPA